MPMTKQLIELIRSKEITPADLQQCALFFLDALASAYAGSATPVGKKVVQWAKGDALNTRTQAFVVGALTHITETDDLHRASVTHPGCIVVPCVIALGSKHNISDLHVLQATLKGFEAMCRVGNAVGPMHYKIWHNTATCGPFGSAMAAAELLDLDLDQTMYALGNAGTQSSGLWQFLQTGAMSKHLHAGRGSEAGVLAAELAVTGFTGSPDILEGKQGLFAGMCPDAQPEKVLTRPEDPWQLLLTSIKPWPSCRHTHPSIDAALDIHHQLGNKVVESVHIDTYQSALDICDRLDATNEYQAKFSLQHCVAKALMDGAVTLTSFDEEARTSAQELRARITVECTEPFKGRYPVSWGAGVSVTTSDGETLRATRTDCKGDPELPLTADEMIAKAQSLMTFGGLASADAIRICDRVLAMSESGESTDFLTEFLQHVY